LFGLLCAWREVLILRQQLAAYYLTDAFQACGAEPLAWREFMERYPHGQPGLPDDPVTRVPQIAPTPVPTNQKTGR
jgi:hypothetical protein